MGSELATVLRLEVDGIDFSDEERISAIEERMPEASFVLQNGVVMAEVVLEAAPERQYEQAVGVIRRLKDQCALEIKRVEPLPVDIADIARLVGVERREAKKWSENAQVSLTWSVGGGENPQKPWNLYSVNEWLSEEKKIKLGLELPSPQLVQEIDAYLAGL